MAWIVLIVSGVLEAVWAGALAASQGLTRLRPTVLFFAALAASMGGLGYALRTIPVGTGYAVWVGIGAVGTSAVAVLVHRETMTLAQIAALAVLVIGIVAVKLTGSTD